MAAMEKVLRGEGYEISLKKCKRGDFVTFFVQGRMLTLDWDEILEEAIGKLHEYFEKERAKGEREMRTGTVSFRELFNSLRESNEQEVVSLAFGEIQRTCESRVEQVGMEDYYDFIAPDGSIVCMDGETCEVLEEADDYILLQEEYEQTPFKLSKSEFDIAFFSDRERDDLDGKEIEHITEGEIKEIIKKLYGQEVLFPDYIRGNIALAKDVVDHEGDYMDLDCMVAMSKVLDRKVSYEEYQIVNRTDLFDNMGLFNVGNEDLPVLNTILSEKWDFSSTSFICQLPEKYQNALREVMAETIENILVGHSDAEKQATVEEGMSGRLCDLEDSLDWRDVLMSAAGGKDFLVPHILAELELEERE